MKNFPLEGPKYEFRRDIITCPNCGAEYTAGEIYIPQAFFGKPEELERESLTHKIINDFGKKMDLREEYKCDYCGTHFEVQAYIKLVVTEIKRRKPITKTKSSLFSKEQSETKE